LQEQLRYWLKQLASLPEPVELPFRSKPDVSQSAANPFDGAIHLVEFSDQDTAAIRALAREQGVTLYMVMLAAYAILLNRLTGAKDLAIGSPVSERTTTDTEGLIGVFVNTVVLRCAIPDQITFRDLLRSVRETVLDAHANHEVPLQRVLSELYPQNGASVPFQTVLAFDSYMGGKGADDSGESKVCTHAADVRRARTHRRLVRVPDRALHRGRDR
jgi:non-ribosomal peptide synthetase component F